MSTVLRGIRQDGTQPDVQEGKVGDARITKKRAVHVNLRKENGDELTDFGGGSGSPAAAPSSFASGRKTVEAPGTAEPLALSTSCVRVHIRALATNQGLVVVGGPDVLAAVDDRNGYPLYMDEPITIKINDLAKLWLDVTVAGEGVSYAYEIA